MTQTTNLADQTERPSPDERIFRQGELDGFCLPYAMMNASKLLRQRPHQLTSDYWKNLGDRSPRWEQWRRLIAVTPSLHAFADGTGSTLDPVQLHGSSESSPRAWDSLVDIRVKNALIQSYLEVLNNQIRKSKLIAEPLTNDDAVLSALSRLGDTPESLILLCLSSGDEGLKTDRGCIPSEHWVCVTGCTEDRFLIACSYSHLLSPLHDSSPQLQDLLRHGPQLPFNNAIEKTNLLRKGGKSGHFYSTTAHRIVVQH